jgi:hypothetical protein
MFKIRQTHPFYLCRLSRYNDGLRAARPELNSRQGQNIFTFSHSVRIDSGPTYPPIKWIPSAVFAGLKRSGLTTHLSLVSRSRMADLQLHSHILV